MSNILVVLASARKGRVAEKVFEYVKKDLDTREDVTITVADLKEINLPFYNHPLSPASPDYEPTDPAVIKWAKLVADADAVVLLTPEYNRTVNAIQKNALDSMKREWVGKPVVVIGYGWSGASHAIITLNTVLPFLEADFKPNPAQLVIAKDITIDGSILDEENVTEQIKTALDEIA